MEPRTPPTPDPERRRRVQLLSLGVGLAAIAVVVVLVLISQSGDESGDTEIETAADSALAGLAQSGDTVGEESAPVTITEFGDLQCPVCRQFAQTVVPELLSGPVADGEAKMRFANWAILGPDSETAAQAALAAGEQDKLWDFVELFYENQGPENTGYVTDDFLRSVAEGAELDVPAWEKAREGDPFTADLKQIDTEATQAGFSGTPSILVSGPGGAIPLQGVPDAEAVEQAISEAAG